MNFEEWYKTNHDEPNYDSYDIAKEAWDYQKARIDKLEKEVYRLTNKLNESESIISCLKYGSY